MSRSSLIIAQVRGFVPPFGALLLLLTASGPVAAGKLKSHNTYGSPLDTLMNTHLTTTVPATKDFVRATSPDKEKLDYTPLTGTDPERPKPRDPKGIEALQAELEGAGARNEVKAKGLLSRKAARKGPAAKAADPAATP